MGTIAGALLLGAGLLVWLGDPAIDLRLHVALHAPANARWLPWLLRLTDLGSGVALIPIGLLACVWLLRTGRKARAAWLFATVASGRIIVELLKLLCGRPRPPVGQWLTSVASLSMPSSHSAGAMLSGLALCVAFGVGVTVWSAAILFALAIGVTRVALGVHWPSDVLAGWGFGLLWASLARRWLPGSRDNR